MSESVSVEEVCQRDILNIMKEKLWKHAAVTKMSSRTSALWIQYMDMVDILRKYIRAERIGSWELHLQAAQDMLPYLAASGHNL